MSVHPLVNVASTCDRKKENKTCLGYRCRPCSVADPEGSKHLRQSKLYYSHVEVITSPPFSKIEYPQNIIDSLLLPYIYTCMIIISLSLSLSLSLRDPLGVTIRLGMICEREKRERERRRENMFSVILLQGLG